MGLFSTMPESGATMDPIAALQKKKRDEEQAQQQGGGNVVPIDLDLDDISDDDHEIQIQNQAYDLFQDGNRDASASVEELTAQEDDLQKQLAELDAALLQNNFLKRFTMIWCVRKSFF